MLIIDGHNLIGRLGWLSLENEEEGRELLLRRVAALKGSGGEQVVVVFDGNRFQRTKGSRFGGVRVVYSTAGVSADEVIVSRIDSMQRGAATVVTSDRELARRVAARGAKVLTAEVFGARIEAKKGDENRPSKPSPDPSDVDHWLEVFGKSGKSDKHKM